MSKKSFFSGKRFLITQPMIRSFCGSTMVTLELADYLSSVGAQVIVYTNIALDPALSSFKAAGIKVISSRDKYNLSLKNFDYVWVHSLTFPKQILEEMKCLPKKVPAFIFLHMSSIDEVPDEHPWIYNLENSLSSLSLYISEAVKDSNVKYGLPPKRGFYRNPAPSKFKELAERKMSRTIKKLLVVSNHPPEEVIEAKKILIKKGIQVDIYGEGQDKYSALSPKVLKKYDAAITIGKTVQYCIVGSFPVYIYDWFGGPGWLTESNYELSKSKGFCGKPFKRKTGKKIAQEIIDGYTDALEYHSSFFASNNDDYVLDSVLGGLLYDLKPRKLKSFNSEYIESAKAAIGCAEIRFIASEELGNLYKYCESLTNDFNIQKKQIEQLTEYKERFDNLSNSKRVKILNKLLKPIDKLRDSFK